MHRDTLARIIGAAEAGPVSGSTIADIIREVHDSSDAMKTVHQCKLKNDGDYTNPGGDNHEKDKGGYSGVANANDATDFIRDLDLDGNGGKVRNFQYGGGDGDNNENDGDNKREEGNEESDGTVYEVAVTV